MQQGKWKQFLFTRRRQRRNAAMLYAALSRLALNPALFSRAGVPDRLEMRFDMLLYIVGIALFRLERGGAGCLPAPEMARMLLEEMFANLQMDLRGMHIAETRLGKYHKPVVGAFYGRYRAYKPLWEVLSDEKALPESRNSSLEDLQRAIDVNILASGDGSSKAVAAYGVALLAWLGREGATSDAALAFFSNQEEAFKPVRLQAACKQEDGPIKAESGHRRAQPKETTNARILDA